MLGGSAGLNFTHAWLAARKADTDGDPRAGYLRPQCSPALNQPACAERVSADAEAPGGFTAPQSHGWCSKGVLADAGCATPAKELSSLRSARNQGGGAALGHQVEWRPSKAV